MKNTDEIDKYVREVFKNEITIFDACRFGITSEFPNKYNFYEQRNNNLDEYFVISGDLEKRIREELKKYELK